MHSVVVKCMRLRLAAEAFDLADSIYFSFFLLLPTVLHQEVAQMISLNRRGDHTQKSILSFLQSRSPPNTNVRDDIPNNLLRPTFDRRHRAHTWVPRSPEANKLLEAASNGDLITVKKLLDARVDPNVVGDSGDTPLHLAAAGGYDSVVERLLQSHADTTIQNNDKWTPIQLATLKKYVAAATNSEARYVKVIETFHHPPVFLGDDKQADTDKQEPPEEKDKDRKNICKYFRGHVSQWAEGRLKDDEYSVYDIIYCGGLVDSAAKLESALKEIVDQRVQGEDIAKGKTTLLRNRETEDQRKVRKREEEKKREEERTAKTQKAHEQTDKHIEDEKPDIKKTAMRWIHLPANNVCSKTSLLLLSQELTVSVVLGEGKIPCPNSGDIFNTNIASCRKGMRRR